MSEHQLTPNSEHAQPAFRKPRFRVLRQDYLEFCGGNTVAALLLDYFASMEHLHDEARGQGETLSEWRAISGTYGGLIVLIQPAPSRETVRKALQVLIAAKLLEAHEDNGKPAERNEAPTPNRYRLRVAKLLRMEAEWRGGVPHAGGGGVVQTTDPPVVQTTHEQEVKGFEKGETRPPQPATEAVGQGDELPDHLGPADVREVRKQTKANDTFLTMTASTLSIAWAEALGAKEPYSHAETLWSGTWNRKAFMALAEQGCTPDELKDLFQDKQKPEASYLLRFAVEDYPAWAQARKAAQEPERTYFTAPDPLPPLSAEEIAAMKAMRRERGI